LEVQKAISISHNLMNVARSLDNPACVTDLAAVHKRYMKVTLQTTSTAHFSKFLQIQETIARFHAQMHAARDSKNQEWLADISAACKVYTDNHLFWPLEEQVSLTEGRKANKLQRLSG
jgi:hypothetical protein